MEPINNIDPIKLLIEQQDEHMATLRRPKNSNIEWSQQEFDEQIKPTLDKWNGRVGPASVELGYSRQRLYKIMQKFGYKKLTDITKILRNE